MMNGRATMSWGVPFVGHPASGSGEVGHLLDKPANWEKVYIIGYSSCSFDSSGKLPPRTQDSVDKVQGKIALNATSLWWVLSGVDAVNLVAKAVEEIGSSAPETIVGYWNTLNKYPGLFGDYTFTPQQHNGYQMDEVVMSKAACRRSPAPIPSRSNAPRREAMAPVYGVGRRERRRR